MLAVIIILVAVVLLAAATFAVLALRRSHGMALSTRRAPEVGETPQVVILETSLDEGPAPLVEAAPAERPRIRDRIGRTTTRRGMSWRRR